MSIRFPTRMMHLSKNGARLLVGMLDVQAAFLPLRFTQAVKGIYPDGSNPYLVPKLRYIKKGSSFLLRNLPKLYAQLPESSSDQAKVDHFFLVMVEKRISLRARGGKGGHTIDSSTLKTRLEHLVGIGCSVEQIMEYPQILDLPEEEISARVKILEGGELSTITVQMLHLAKSKEPELVRDLVAEYAKVMKGHTTVKGYICDKLNCNEQEARVIGIRIPQIKDVVNFDKKINFLRESGASLQDIKINVWSLDKSFTSLKLRVDELLSLGLNKPLPLAWVVRSEDSFRKLVNSYKEESE